MIPADSGSDEEVWLGAVVLLTRRPSDASPDALHPGKARETSEGENVFSPSDVSGLSWARSPQTFRHPSAPGGACLLIPTAQNRLLWVQGPQDPGAGLGARSPQRSLLFD